MISYLATSIFLRLPIAIKSLLLGAMGVVYILLIELSHAAVFACWDQRSDSMVPLHIVAVIVAVVFVLAVALHGRQVRRGLIYFFVFLNKLVVRNVYKVYIFGVVPNRSS